MFDTTNMSPFAENHNSVGGGASRATLTAIPSKYCRGKSGLSRVELALLAYVIDHPEPWQQGSRSAIAEDCDCAPNSVPRAARRLIALELIKTVPGGGARNTIYRLGRNMEVTESIDARNADVSRNVEGTTVETSKLRAANSEEQTETTTTDSVVTQVTGGRNIPPPHPPNNNLSSMSKREVPSETEEPSLEGVQGEEFELAGDEPVKPKRARRKQHPKFVATDDTLPKQMLPAMTEIATERGLVNGTCELEFKQWRRYHIENQTVMMFVNRSWQTWVNNWAKNAKSGAAKRTDGKRQIKLGDGQIAYTKRHQPTMRAARA